MNNDFACLLQAFNGDLQHLPAFGLVIERIKGFVWLNTFGSRKPMFTNSLSLLYLL